MKMKPGDLLQVRHRRVALNSWGPARILGILLEPPQFPKWGNYPKNYTVLTPEGVRIIADGPRHAIEVCSEPG